MTLLDFGAYAGIVGGTIYLLLLFAFRNLLAGDRKISWIIQLEIAIFIILTGFIAWGTTKGYIPVSYLGIIGWYGLCYL